MTGASFAATVIPGDLAIDFRDYNNAEGRDSYTQGVVTVEALPNDSYCIDYKLS